ncbi:unnamed protein product [Prorocentrum cordatum]|uniref:Protein RFT1 homolog n=1 Tax=Prorocentrum cordatum TaxID=2364126 RepID=A0ABN9PIJ3_9DINO|nr:unnamed protein product [Polarella glacialis]
MLAAAVGVTLAAAALDVLGGRPAGEGRPRAWAAALLLCSYCALIPGLSSTLLSITMIVNVVGHRINVHPDSGKPSCTESTPGLARLMYETGSTLGAVLIVLFAMVVPALEVSFLVLGEVFRNRSGTACDRRIGAVILWVQHRSKWASPDMFAQILMVSLVRGLNHPDLILADARLDVGFTCFAYFCVGATASALGFPLPEAAEREPPEPPAWLPRWLGGRVLAVSAWALAALFAALLVAGCQSPVMSLRIDDRPLYKPQGPLPLEAKRAVEMLGVVQMLGADVSVQDSVGALWGWAGDGEVNSAVGCVMLAVFAVGVAALDVLALALCASLLCLAGCDGGAAGRAGSLLRSATAVLRRLSMLDVAIVGIYLVTVCMSVYKSIGVTVSTRRGLHYLLCAEAVHLVLHHAVSGAARLADAARLGAARRACAAPAAPPGDAEEAPRGGFGACCPPRGRPWLPLPTGAPDGLCAATPEAGPRSPGAASAADAPRPAGSQRKKSPRSLRAPPPRAPAASSRGGAVSAPRPVQACRM